MKDFIKLDKSDNVCVALKDYQSVKAGHKFADCDISTGEKIIKYGFPIGTATCNIARGEHVHVHNLKSALSEGDENEFSESAQTQSRQQSEQFFCGNLGARKLLVNKFKSEKFLGYRRKDGRAATRNDIYIVCTVGCINSVAEKICVAAKRQFTNIDDIIAVTHPYGCSQMGDDLLYTQKILAGICLNPNAGGVLVLSLGCENNNILEFSKVLGQVDGNRVKFLALQQASDDILDAVKIISQIYKVCKLDVREECSLADLVIGLKCGGSDGYSGITANYLVGIASDITVNAGGTSILTEVPEMFGSELLLTKRCCNRQVFDSTESLINDFKDYYKLHGQVIYENPSPGNKDGGITTLEEKSLGCTNKSGFSEISGVVMYGNRNISKGLNLLQSPGNDIVAQTALVASGATLILFTTGRGTPLGAIVPTLKISSNSALYKRKNGWIDFDAGRMLGESVQAIAEEETFCDNTNVSAQGETFFDNTDILAEEFIKLIIKTASGKNTKNEENGYKEIAIFKNGVTL